MVRVRVRVRARTGIRIRTSVIGLGLRVAIWPRLGVGLGLGLGPSLGLWVETWPGSCSVICSRGYGYATVGRNMAGIMPLKQLDYTLKVSE